MGVCWHCLEEKEVLPRCCCPGEEPEVCLPCFEKHRAMDEHLLRHGCLPGAADDSETEVDEADDYTDEEEEEDEELESEEDETEYVDVEDDDEEEADQA